MARARCQKARRTLRALGQEDGNSLIETALVLTVVFLMTFGFIDFCLILFGMGNVNFASRVALRYASLHSATSYAPTTQADLNRIITPYIYRYPANTFSVTPSYYSTNTVGSGVYITVTITYGFSMFGRSYNGITYSTTGVGVVEQ